MEAKASVKYLKVSPQKARLVVDLIRGRKVDEAVTILAHTKKAVGRDIAKLVKSALANAENNMNLDVDSLYVKTATVDHGPTTKRMHARAMGRGTTIRKRTSHITIVLDETKAG
jgi:large subunit ribosomal protein L22